MNNIEPLLDKKDYTIGVEIHPLNGDFYIHSKILNWSPSVYKAFLQDWCICLEEFKDQGIKYIYSLSYDHDKDATIRWYNMWGFEPAMTTPDGGVVFRQEI